MSDASGATVPRTATRRLAEFALGERPSAPGEDVEWAARLHLLDTLGVGIAAQALDEVPYAVATAETAAAGPATVIGMPTRRAAADAALANGILCHALDFDDTHGPSIAHVSTVVVPAALAAAQDHGAGFGPLLAALIAGNEITCRVGAPVGDAFHRRGFHPTAICGVFGATAAVGRLAGVSEVVLVQALGIAGSMAAGLLAFRNDGSATKRIHPGWMAHAAHTAIHLADHGATGPADVLEGPAGIYHAFLERRDVDVPTDDLGTHWETPSIAIKPYPAGHVMHAPLDALRRLRERRGVRPEDIERIVVLCPQMAADMVLIPIEQKRRPRTPYEAKFSAPFSIGWLLQHGEVDLRTYTHAALDDARVLELAARVEVSVTDYPTFPASFSGGVRLVLNDGSEMEEHLLHERGGSRNPMTTEEVVEKFCANAALGLDATRAQALADWVLTAPPDGGLDGFAVLERVAGRPAVRQ